MNLLISDPDLKKSATSSQKRYNAYFNKQLQNKELQTTGGSFNLLAKISFVLS